MPLSVSRVIVVLSWFALAACYTAPDAEVGGEAHETAHDSSPVVESSSTSLAADGGVRASDLPCAVAALLAERCVSCHSASHPSAPMPLVTREDLLFASPSDKTRTVAAEALDLMKSTRSPMPPSGPRASDAEIAAFEAWLGSGAKPERCDTR